VVVAALIVAMLAAVTTPSLLGFIDRQRAQTTADKLASIGAGVAAFKAAVLTGGAGTNTYPGRISELTNLITTSTVTSINSCGTAFTNGAVTTWSATGPFLTFFIPNTGYVTPIGTINDATVRVPNSATVGVMKIQIPNVGQEDANALDQIVDGGDGGTTGVVQWIAFAGGNTSMLSYLIPLANKC
jgi:type II secretory pathway pseudopilin PulG